MTRGRGGSGAEVSVNQDTQAIVSLPPHCIPDRLCDKLPRPFEKANI